MEKTEKLTTEKRNAGGALRFLSAKLRKHIPMLLLLSFMMAAVSVLSVSMALFMRKAIDSAIAGNTSAMTWSLVSMVAVTVVALTLRFFSKLMQSRLSYRMEITLRRSLLGSIITADYMTVSAYHSGDLMNRLTNDISVVSAAASGLLPKLFELAARIGFAFGILISFDWFFAVITLAGAAVIGVISLIVRPRLKRLHRRMQETEGDTRAFMQETIENQLVVRVFGARERMLERGGEFMERGFAAAMKRRMLSIFTGEGMSFIFTLGVVAALCWGTLSIAGVLGPERVITYGTLAAVLQLVSQVQAPFAAFAGLVPQFFAMTASCERLMEIENIRSEYELPEGEAAQNSKAEIEADDFRGISINEVSFAYGREGARTPVLSGASANVDRGDFIAITGISGIGKSTLMKLLLGVYAPDEGSIDIRFPSGSERASSRTRPLFAYVPQGNLLLSGTVRENIAFFDSGADDESIMRAARIACAEEFIKELPDGLDTMIGEHALGLSEGQAQRLSVARAVLRGAPVLLLDEATSALDAETEAQLLRNLRASDIETVIIITHKSAALAVCDKEIRIVNGGIVTCPLK